MQNHSLSAYYQTADVARIVSLVGQALLILLTLFVFAPAYSWMFDAFTANEHRFQLIASFILLGFLLHKAYQPGTTRTLNMKFVLRRSSLAVFVISVCGFLVNEYFLDIHIISAALGVLVLYALFGFYASANTWRKGMLPTLLLIILLPFGDYLNVYLGFPLRLLTASVSADLLHTLGYNAVSSETLIVLENHYSNVDISCSGVKGIWSGLAFFVLLTWIEGKSLNTGWLWRLGIFLLALIGANVLRVSLLVFLDQTLQYVDFAELVHEFLGILGFAFACMLGWGLLLSAQKSIENTTYNNQASPVPQKYGFIALLLLLTLALLIYTPMPRNPIHSIDTKLQLPGSWSASAGSLSVEERRFFNRNQASADKFEIVLPQGLRASLIAVHSSYWKGQHDPKNCLIAQGYKIISDSTLRLSNNDHIRLLHVMHAEQPLIAVYWFQNTKVLTDDYSKRLFSSLFDRDEPWVLASMLVEKPTTGLIDIRDLIYPVKAAIHEQLIRNN